MKRAALVLTVLAIATPLRAQSLADAAKKAEEQRGKTKQDQAKAPDASKSSQPPAVTLTNKDLAAPTAPPSATSPDPTKPASAAKDSSPKASVDKPAEPVKDEAWWRARMNGLRGTLDQATKARLAKAVLVVRLEAVRDNVPERGFSVAQAYAAASSELAKARADLEVAVGAENAAKTAVNDAEEEARTHNVLPGWLR